MAATNQDIKDFFALSGANPAVTNAHLTRLQAAIERFLAITGGDADDFVNATYQFWRDQVLDQELSVAQDAVPQPTAL